MKYNAQLALLLAIIGNAYAQIIPDGTTVTQVHTDGTGKPVIALAPQVGGVSYNAFEDFNISNIGLDLDNQNVGAQTIINEVSSTKISRLEGPLSVLGPQAHVIIANPNGISINGLGISNIGHVALTTGKIETWNAGQINVHTQNGLIEIQEQGMIGAWQGLDLIAKNIHINGPLENLHSADDAYISMLAGESKVQFSAVKSFSNQNDWAQVDYSALGNSNTAGFAVDIGPLAGIKSGRIRILVNDQGAGVRHAGLLQARSGEFSLSSSGEVQIKKGRIKSHKENHITAHSIKAEQGAEIISENSGILWQAFDGDIKIHETKLQAYEKSYTSLSSLGAITLESSNGNIDTYKSDFKTHIDDLVLSAFGEIKDEGSIWNSGHDWIVSSQNNVSLEESQAQISGKTQITSIGDLLARAAKILTKNDLRFDAVNMRFISDDQGRNHMESENAGLILQAQGQIYNLGGLLQGANKSAIDPLSLGAVTIYGTQLDNIHRNAEHLGVIFGQAESVHAILAQSLNNQGRILANGDVSLQAPNIYNQSLIAGNVSSPNFNKTKTKRRWWSLWTKRKKSLSWSLNYGSLSIPYELAEIASSIGQVSLKGQNYYNWGGLLSAGQDLKLEQNAIIENRSLTTGKLNYYKTCLIFCTEKVSSSLNSEGGIWQAGGHLYIKSAQDFKSLGGSISSAQDMEIYAKHFNFTAQPSYSFLERPRTLRTLLTRKTGSLRSYILPSGLYSAAGLKIQSETSPIFDGVSYQAKTQDFNQIITLQNQQEKIYKTRNIGFIPSWL